MILSAPLLILTLAASSAAGDIVIPRAAQVFRDACLDGSVRLSQAKSISADRIARGTRSALIRASRIEYYRPARVPHGFNNFGPIYETAQNPQTYLIPQMSTDPSQSSRPVCVVLTKDKDYWGTARAIKLWGEPNKPLPTPPPGSGIGAGIREGVVSDITFEARIKKHSVAVFRESGWLVMRALDLGDRNYPYTTIPAGKKK